VASELLTFSLHLFDDFAFDALRRSDDDGTSLTPLTLLSRATVDYR